MQDLRIRDAREILRILRWKRQYYKMMKLKSCGTFQNFTETETDHNKPDLILPEKEDLLNSRCYMPI